MQFNNNYYYKLGQILLFQLFVSDQALDITFF